MDIKRDPPKKTKRNVLIGVGVVAFIGVTAALSQLEARPPSVSRAEVIIDSVRQGELVRQVRAPGTLVPENIRYVAAVTSGRVEERPLRPGSMVTASTVILVLSNPDEQLQLLTAEQALSQAEQDLVTLRTTLESNQLGREAAIAQLETQLGTAERQLQTLITLDSTRKGLASPNELKGAQELVSELKKRIDIEKKQLELAQTGAVQQLRTAEENVSRQRAVVRFRQDRIAALRVPAGIDGQLQRMDLELGQWVNSGVELARVAQPGRFKAVLRVPETQAPDVAVGQEVEIDLRPAIVKGTVMRIDPVSTNATVEVEVSLEGDMPQGARADLSVDGTIQIERLPDVKYVQRPAYGQANQTVGLFKLDPDGRTATRVNVQLGKASVNQIEVRAGLEPGDRVIISDMSNFETANKVRIN